MTLHRFQIVLLLSALAASIDQHLCWGFVQHLPRPSVSFFPARRQLQQRGLFSTTEDEQTAATLSQLFPVDYDDPTTAAKSTNEVEMTMLDFSLPIHRPLGLSIEESLADSRFVFVTKITLGGNADTAGLKVGDTLVSITGLFGKLSPAVGVGVDAIKGMVASRPAEEALEIQVARGTSVFDDHEKAVIELCSNDSSDQEVEQCVIDYLSIDYQEQKESDLEERKKAANNAELDEECDPSEDEADCLVGNLQDMWAEDLPPPTISTPSEDSDSSEVPKEAVKPWSNRSSGSGTYVRDPMTGEMKNIDA